MIEVPTKAEAVGEEPVSREVWRSPANWLLSLATLLVGMTAGLALIQAADLCPSLRFAMETLWAVVVVWLAMAILFRPRQTLASHQRRGLPPTAPSQYLACGLGPLDPSADPRQLYLDQIKRALLNVLYEDPPFWFYDHRKQPQLAAGFSLARRVRGEDSPTLAHTMIGLRRLNHLQQCIEDLLERGVPGDLVETGSYRGGATIFMRAVLRAYGDRTRRVFACDSFVPPSPPPPPVVVMPVIQLLASLPGRAWRRAFFLFLQRLPKARQAFPDVAEPSDDLVQFVLWNLRNPVGFNHPDPTSAERVRSHFARYGLLDEQVVLLEGFFADTLPKAPFEQVALARLDGDTLESTRDAITHLYPKLSRGGYLVVDDYYSFEDCRRAVDAYRDEQGIRAEIRPIDNLAVFWQKDS